MDWLYPETLPEASTDEQNSRSSAELTSLLLFLIFSLDFLAGRRFNQRLDLS
jgi:hypothetical protein